MCLQYNDESEIIEIIGIGREPTKKQYDLPCDSRSKQPPAGGCLLLDWFYVKI